MGNISSDVFKLTNTEYSKVPFLNLERFGYYLWMNIMVTMEFARGAYQADSTDYKTLNLLQAKEGYIPAKIIQEFINTGAFIEADKKQKRKLSANPWSEATIQVEAYETPIPKSNQVDKKR